MKRAVHDGDEYDALTPVHRYLIWRSGARKRVKQRANRRDRRTQRLALRKES